MIVSVPRLMYKHYLSLVKPGIIMGNLIASTGGFFFASKGDVNWIIFLAVLMGTSLVVASGCAFNNIIDADIDGKMSRTQTRPLVTHQVPVSHAFWLGLLSGVSGFLILGVFGSLTALFFAILGFAVYVGLYSLYFKRHSVHGTLIGSVSGACPPVIGYTAVTNSFDLAGLLIFVLFCAWQMPHSYAIAINRKQDYINANIPVLPVIKGIKVAQTQMVSFTLLFGACVVYLYALGFTGVITFFTMLGGTIYWLYQMIRSYGKNDESQRKWGKDIFFTSVMLVTFFSILISFDYTA